MFAVICALSERVAALDEHVRNLVNKLDARAMEAKLQGCKDMFYLLDDKQDGLVEMDTLAQEIRAGLITSDHEKLIIDKFSENGKAFVDFLDFLTLVIISRRPLPAPRGGSYYCQEPHAHQPAF